MNAIQEKQQTLLEKIEKALKTDEQLSVGLMLDLKQVENSCYQVFTATVQINISVPVNSQALTIV